MSVLLGIIEKVTLQKVENYLVRSSQFWDLQMFSHDPSKNIWPKIAENVISTKPLTEVNQCEVFAHHKFRLTPAVIWGQNSCEI